MDGGSSWCPTAFRRSGRWGRAKERRAHAALGGLVTAVRPAVENRDTLWFGWSGDAVEAERVSNTPKEETSGDLTVATVDLSAAGEPSLLLRLLQPDALAAAAQLPAPGQSRRAGL